MRLDELYAAIDAKPFRPFVMDVVSGTQIPVSHPENIFVLPSRQKVHHIEVYQDKTWKMSITFPEGLVGLHFPDPATPAAG